MHTVTEKDELREQVAEWRSIGDHVAIVPTMGNLHAGHISLVNVAREHAERVVVTVFVNPTQFGEGEDFETYPRTLEMDTRRLKTVTADILFVPDVATVYPFGTDQATQVSVPGLTSQLCGSFRPGHFDGVTTVVARLFALVQPDTAVFGQKDFQQQLIIRRMVEDLNLPITMVTAPTVREDDGLAMSSRNAYLDDAERSVAPQLYATLCDVRERIREGSREFGKLEKTATDTLRRAGFEPDYVAIRRAADLEAQGPDSAEIVILAAARLGKARLIDNVLLST